MAINISIVDNNNWKRYDYNARLLWKNVGERIGQIAPKKNE